MALLRFMLTLILLSMLKLQCKGRPNLNFVLLIHIELPQVSAGFRLFIWVFKAAARCSSVGSDTFKTFSSITFLCKFNDIAGFAEPFGCAVVAFALDFNAVIHHTVEYAGIAVNA